MKKSVMALIAVLGVALAAFGGYYAGTHKVSGMGRLGKDVGRADPPAAPAGKGGEGSEGSGAPAKGGASASPPGAGVAVQAAKVATVSLPQTLTAVGSLRSDESVMVRPEVAGRVSGILFQEGQHVGKGAPLVRLDTSINDADVKQARANLTLARSKFDRSIELQQRGFISTQARDEAENNLRVAEAAVALAEAKLAKTQIRAPFAGIIGLRQVSVGDYVKEGADIVNLEAIDPLKVDFRIPEVFFRQVQVGQSLDVALDAQPGQQYTGKVYAVNPLVDAAGRSVVVRAMVRNPQTTLRPGMFARVRLITRNVSDAMVVPEHALVPQGEDQFVFRVVDGRAQRVKVEVGQRRDGKAEIVKGLEPEDVVVTAGQLKIRDGAQLQVARVDVSASGPATASASDRPAPRKAGTETVPAARS